MSLVNIHTFRGMDIKVGEGQACVPENVCVGGGVSFSLKLCVPLHIFCFHAQVLAVGHP